MGEQETYIWLIVAAAIKGEATEEQKQILEQWLGESNENKLLYQSVSRMAPISETVREDSRVRIFNKIKESIAFRKANARIRLWKYSAVASVALLIAVVSVSLLRESVADKKVTFVEAQTAFGIKSKIILADSTVVYLNSGTEISYPERFTGKDRRILLNGEAYFEVHKNGKHPFTVETDKLDIKVFGTHFNVSAYRGDNIETTLLEGSVGVFKKELAILGTLGISAATSYSQETKMNLSLHDASITDLLK
jgi:transmembrane sensor